MGEVLSHAVIMYIFCFKKKRTGEKGKEKEIVIIVVTRQGGKGIILYEKYDDDDDDDEDVNWPLYPPLAQTAVLSPLCRL